MSINQIRMRLFLRFILAVLMSQVFTLASAYDFSQENNDGVIIYYNYINNGTELEVTGKSYPNASYTGTVDIPETVTYMNRTREVTSIGKNAFYNCVGLSSVIIPNSVTNIGERAFYYCDNLSFVKLGNKISSIGNLAFGYCSNLSSVSLPNSVKSIGEGAFYWCTKFTSITIPRNVISIGWAAFDGCNMATVISEITEPFAISTDTFSNNTYYNATLKVPTGTVEKYKAADGWNKFSFIEENTTAVEYLKSDRDVSKNSHIYNLNGLRLEIPRKGINIINSKIVVLK